METMDRAAREAECKRLVADLEKIVDAQAERIVALENKCALLAASLAQADAELAKLQPAPARPLRVMIDRECVVPA